MKKHFISVILSLIMIFPTLFLIGGCNTNNNESTPTPTPTPVVVEKLRTGKYYWDNDAEYKPNYQSEVLINSTDAEASVGLYFNSLVFQVFDNCIILNPIIPGLSGPLGIYSKLYRWNYNYNDDGELVFTHYYVNGVLQDSIPALQIPNTTTILFYPNNDTTGLRFVYARDAYPVIIGSELTSEKLTINITNVNTGSCEISISDISLYIKGTYRIENNIFYVQGEEGEQGGKQYTNDVFSARITRSSNAILVLEDVYAYTQESTRLLFSKVTLNV